MGEGGTVRFVRAPCDLSLSGRSAHGGAGPRMAHSLRDGFELARVAARRVGAALALVADQGVSV